VPTSSTLIYSNKDAILVNAQLTTKASNELLEWVIESGKDITHIYIIYTYGDHFFSSAPILDRFPKAILVVTPEVVAKMSQETTPERLSGL
jgi:glyoxylase-like metal-dependent hydrolase (beta-lactamase superfamily II)